MKSGKNHVAPLRRCVACGNRTTKRELLRIVATPLGTVEVDTAGNLPGRGAYICKDGLCAQVSLKRGRLEYTLRRGLRDEEWADVATLIESIATVE